MKYLLEDIYAHLLRSFGHRHWWPAETRDEVIIGAILTQSVAWKNVKTAINNLKHHDLLTLEAVYKVDASIIAPLIKPTRFYNQKAKKLKAFTEFLFSKYGGSLDVIFSEDLEELRKELLTVNGLGEETVDSILLYAGGKSIFVIDAYTKRVFSRLGLTDEKWSYREYQRFFMERLDRNVELYNDFHAQIVHLGHVYCKKNNPQCQKCPLKEHCEFVVNSGYHEEDSETCS